ncbi:uncharacterized protein [Euwallacea similis]|uniref:uncharacterized protein n=1 Tax=Euwallacea similis TaxID=1736056 RepID=UPI00344C20D8
MGRIKKYAHMMLSVQRKALLRVICAYRTVSYEAVQVLAGIPPLDLLLEERMQLSTLPRVTGEDRKAVRKETIRKWQERWTNLEEKGKTEPECGTCGVEDTAEHCIFRCSVFNTLRHELRTCVNALTPKNLIEAMLESKEKWNKCSHAISETVKEKERMERASRVA